MVKWKISEDHQIQELRDKRRFTRKSGGSTVVGEVFVNDAGSTLITLSPCAG
jgi:hypothetical protein